MADALGMGVIAEGVETKAQLTQLIDLGCPHGQGYLVSPAVAFDEATELLLKR